MLTRNLEEEAPDRPKPAAGDAYSIRAVVALAVPPTDVRNVRRTEGVESVSRGA